MSTVGNSHRALHLSVGAEDLTGEQQTGGVVDVEALGRRAVAPRRHDDGRRPAGDGARRPEGELPAVPGIGQVARPRARPTRAGPSEPVAEIGAAALVDHGAAVGGHDLDRAVGVVAPRPATWRVPSPAVHVTAAVPEKSYRDAASRVRATSRAASRASALSFDDTPHAPIGHAMATAASAHTARKAGRRIGRHRRNPASGPTGASMLTGSPESEPCAPCWATTAVTFGATPRCVAVPR